MNRKPAFINSFQFLNLFTNYNETELSTVVNNIKKDLKNECFTLCYNC